MHLNFSYRIFVHIIFCYGLVIKDREVCDKFPKEIDKSIPRVFIVSRFIDSSITTKIEMTC